MTTAERARLRDQLLHACGRNARPHRGPVPIDRLLDLAVEAYYRNRHA
jgi:hypothetical protein